MARRRAGCTEWHAASTTATRLLRQVAPPRMSLGTCIRQRSGDEFGLSEPSGWQAQMAAFGPSRSQGLNSLTRLSPDGSGLLPVGGLILPGLEIE